MAFWGTEVKPGRPFTHAPPNGNRRLRLSGATLGMGISTQKSIVQCNLGNKRPVFVCCLFPEKAEFCTLNLEFEESDEVVFSVIGPRTVHLTGYYRSTSSRSLNDGSESYGEDIGETDTERSENSQESEYGGSFINDDDDDLEVFLSSPESSPPPGSNEKTLDMKKSKDGKGRRRRLRKKYRLCESENDGTSQQKYFTSAVAAVQVSDSEMEDALPISFLSRAKHASNSGKTEVEEKDKKETADRNDNEAEHNATTLDGTNAAQPESESGLRNEEKDNFNKNEAEDNATVFDGRKVAIDAQPKCESGLGNEEKDNFNKNEAEDNATVFDGTKVAIDAQPECESGLGNEKKDNFDKNEAEDNATVFDGTKVAIDAQPKCESGFGNEEKDNFNKNEAEDNATVFGGTKVAIDAQPECELGLMNEERGNLNNNEAEGDATILDGIDAAIDALPKCKSGVRNEEKGNLTNKEADDDATMLDVTIAAIDAQPKSELGVRNEEKPKRVLGVDAALMPKNKTEELAKVERFPEGAYGMIGEVVLEQNELASKEECKHNDLLPAASQVCLEDGAKLKRKRQKRIKKKALEDNVSNEDEGPKSGPNLDSVTQDVHLVDKGTQKQVNDKKRKKKKRCKGKEDGDAMKTEPPVLSANQKDGSVVEMECKNANDRATQLSNGIIIEELEMGKADGKVASLGKKVYVHYIVKLKESGQLFDSTAGKPLTKFRLGEEKIPELWNVGLDGMRVGGKRRLIVPPSMSYRNEGAGENIPSNSWLVFDVELVKVR